MKKHFLLMSAVLSAALLSGCATTGSTGGMGMPVMTGHMRSISIVDSSERINNLRAVVRWNEERRALATGSLVTREPVCFCGELNSAATGRGRRNANGNISLTSIPLQ